jgi:hypothetical protein
MRFKWEFKLSEQELNGAVDHLFYKKSDNEAAIGHMIAETFGWQTRRETTPNGPITERHTLQIEAFPIDKWIEFKNKIFDAINASHVHNGPVNGLKILEAIKTLESFGKPTEAEKETHNDH